MVPQNNPPLLSRAYAWFSALLNDDTTQLDALLAHGVPIDTIHPLRHSTALMEATRLGRAGTVQWLIERGATPAFLCGLPPATALHCALRRQHWDIASLLASAMHSCAVIDAYGATPLHVLCTEAVHIRDHTISLGLAAILFAKSCPLDALDHEGTTALHHCVINDAQELATLLLRYNANPNALIPDSHVSPLAIAALEKNIEMARLLLQHGADPHLRTREGSSPVSIYPAIAPLVNEGHAMRSEMLYTPVSTQLH